MLNRKVAIVEKGFEQMSQSLQHVIRTQAKVADRYDFFAQQVCDVCVRV
jgi:predicted metal-dependent TIM-barrel fold hydrolase